MIIIDLDYINYSCFLIKMISCCFFAIKSIGIQFRFTFENIYKPFFKYRFGEPHCFLFERKTFKFSYKKFKFKVEVYLKLFKWCDLIWREIYEKFIWSNIQLINILKTIVPFVQCVLCVSWYISWYMYLFRWSV